MKKGLLSILAGALVIVGCQNYDDQFDSLEQQINALASQVSAITQVQSDLSALATQVSSLAGSQLTAADLASVTTQVDAIKTQIDALSAVGEEVDNLNEEVDEILEALGELLQANAVIEQDLKISNEAELEYVEGLIGTEEDDPTVIIKGNLEVLGASLDSDALAARLNAVVSKVKTVIGTVTITADAAVIDASTIGFINGDANISNDVTITSLATVSGDLDLGHYGALDLSTLITVNSLDLTNAASITTLNIGNLTGTLNTKEYAIATDITLGDITLTGTVTATKADSFTWGFDSDISTGILISVASRTTVFMQKVPSISSVVTLTNDGVGSQGHFDALTTIANNGGRLTNPAETIAMSALTTVSGTLVIDGTANAIFPVLATQGGPISASLATVFTADNLADGASITTSSTAAISVKSVISAANYTASPTITSLATSAQSSTLDLGLFPGLTSADITVAGTKDTSISVSANVSNTALAALTVQGVVNTLNVTNAPKLATLETTGNITDFVVANSVTMTTITFGHSFISGDTAATVTVSGVTKVAALDLSSLTKVKTVNIVNNTALASIVAPNSTTLAEPVADISVTLSGNALTGNYNKATAGSETTPYAEASIQSTELAGFKTYIEAYAAQTDRTSTGSASATSTYVGTSGKITYNMDVDVVTIDAGTTTNTLSAALDADTAAEAGLDATADTADDTTDSSGGVTTKNELDIVSAP
jgi:formylmethanofuran dehydrogenase subunit C